jgi:hypothetical protein
MFVALTACNRVPVVGPPPLAPDLGEAPSFTIHSLAYPSIPAPLVEVDAGSIQALIPDTWDAEPLPETRYPQQGFVASPEIGLWDTSAGTVRGMEIFWVDVAKLEIPSDYYYLVARGPAIGSLMQNKDCVQASQQVFADHPPDLTGHRFSPSDYVATGSGTCRTDGVKTRWAYVVAAPGYGPLRQVGIPTSALYVLVAVVSGPRANLLLQQLISGARFNDTTISDIEQAARSTR